MYISKVHIEGIIAHKLLTSYFYDSDHINHKGALLFPRTEDDNDIYSHRSLICDDRGYVWSDCKPETYSEPELQALKLLINWTPDTIEDFTKEFLSKLNKKFKKDKGTIQFEPLNINGKDYVLSHQVNEIYGNYSGLHIGKVGTKDNMISQKLLKHDLKDFIKIIPTILRNYAV